MSLNLDWLKKIIGGNYQVLSMQDLMALVMGQGSFQDRLARLIANRANVALGRALLDQGAQRLLEQLDAVMEVEVPSMPVDLEARVKLARGLAVNQALQLAQAANLLDDYVEAEAAVVRKKAELGRAAVASQDPDLERLRLEKYKVRQQFVLLFSGLGRTQVGQEATPVRSARPAGRSGGRAPRRQSPEERAQRQADDLQAPAEGEFLRVGAPKAPGTPPSGDLSALGQRSTDPSDPRTFDGDEVTTADVEGQLPPDLNQEPGDEGPDHDLDSDDEGYEDLSELTVEELKSRLEELGVTKGLSQLRKDELVERLEQAYAEQDDDQDSDEDDEEAQ